MFQTEISNRQMQLHLGSVFFVLSTYMSMSLPLDTSSVVVTMCPFLSCCGSSIMDMYQIMRNEPGDDFHIILRLLPELGNVVLHLLGDGSYELHSLLTCLPQPLPHEPILTVAKFPGLKMTVSVSFSEFGSTLTRVRIPFSLYHILAYYTFHDFLG